MRNLIKPKKKEESRHSSKATNGKAVYGSAFLKKTSQASSPTQASTALGVGANTAIFSIVNAVLLRSLPYRDPDRLVRISFDDSGSGLRNVLFSVPELDDLRNRAGVFEDVSTIGGGSVNLTGAKEPKRLEFVVTHPNYFSMLGAVPQIGRLFGPQDSAVGFAPVAVISDGVRRRSYGADPTVLGRTVRLDNDAYTIDNKALPTPSSFHNRWVWGGSSLTFVVAFGLFGFC